MIEIKYESIIESIDKHSCPGMFYCTVATTCHDELDRRGICLDCWLRTMEERGVKVTREAEDEITIVSSGNV